MKKERLHSGIPAGLALATAVLLASSALAQSSDVGLSTVRAQRFGRPSLPNANVDGGDFFGTAFAAGDFNGDGADDLAVGAPESDGPTTGTVDKCGSVIVRYGIVGKGLATAVAPTVLGQFVGPFNSAEAGDRFGSALTACNLNGDAYDDLVVGVPFETITVGFDVNFPQAGMIEVYYGTNVGLVSPSSTSRREVANQNLPTAGAHFGAALACGDFNADGYDDLAVGLPLRDLPSGALDAGRINVFAGSPAGIAAGALAIDQDSFEFAGVGETGDNFGATLVAGDWNSDGFDDLAVSVPFETDGNQIATGAVHLIYGQTLEFGLGPNGDRAFFDSDFGGTNGSDRKFGQALAVGNFDADPFPDLAISAAFDDAGGAQFAGQFVEAFGSPARLSADGSERFDQDRIVGQGSSGLGELFGFALATGDFDGDGIDDLAASAPSEGVLGTDDGAVTVVMGAPGVGLDPVPNRFRQVNRGLEGFPGDVNEHSVKFGEVLATGDFDGDGYADLAIGAPFESEEGMPQVGTVTVLYGALFADGFEDVGTGFWSAFVP